MSTTKIVIEKLTDIHRYRVTGKYWSRIGLMIKRYGEDTMLKAIETVPEKEIPLDKMLGIIEKKCQNIIENGGQLDELAEMLLS